jgi:hypothetical protein
MMMKPMIFCVVGMSFDESENMVKQTARLVRAARCVFGRGFVCVAIFPFELHQILIQRFVLNQMQMSILTGRDVLRPVLAGSYGRLKPQQT